MNLIPSDWSRAEQYDDEEDAFLNDAESITPFHYVSSSSSSTPDEKIDCDFLVIGVHHAGSTFVKSLIQSKQNEQHQQLRATIVEDTSGYDANGEERKNNAVIANIYSILAGGKTTVFVEMTQTIHDKHANWFSMLLSEHINVSERVIVLDSLKVFQYRSDEIPAVPHVTCIQTQLDRSKHAKNENGLVLPSYLPCPNLLSGAAAAVLSDCQMLNKSAISFVTLEENHALDVSAVAAYEKYVLPIVGIPYLKKKKGQFDYVSSLPKNTTSSLYL